MKYKAILFATTIAISLGGCVTQSDGTIKLTDEAQQSAAQICKFIPTVTTVLGILNLGIPGLSTAQAVAEKVCELVPKSPPKAGERRAPIIFQGVVINGNYTAR